MNAVNHLVPREPRGALLLTIDGTLYELAIDRPEFGRTFYTVQKYRVPEDRYTVSDTWDEGVSCTCKGFHHRSACKHLGALRAVGLVSTNTPAAVGGGE